MATMKNISGSIKKIFTGTHSHPALSMMSGYNAAWVTEDITLPETIGTSRASFRITGPHGTNRKIGSNVYDPWRQFMWEFIDGDTVRVYVQNYNLGRYAGDWDWELIIYNPPVTVYHGVAQVTATVQGFQTKSHPLPRTHDPSMDSLKVHVNLAYTHWFTWLAGPAYSGAVWPRLQSNQIDIYFSDNYGNDIVRMPYSIVCPRPRS